MSGESLLRRAAPSDIYLIIAHAILVGLTCAVLCASRYPPAIDFPQHVVQLTAWTQYNNAAFDFAQQFEVNYRTPYLLGFLLARPFVGLLGAIAALKLVIACAVLGHVASLSALLRSVDQDPWLGLFGYPLAFGFSFYSGFLNFLLATPLVITTLVLSLYYARRPTRSRALALSICLFVTFVCHGFAFAMAASFGCILCFGESSGANRLRVLHYWPFAMGGVIALPWLIAISTNGVDATHTTLWWLDLQRVVGLPSSILSAEVLDPLAMGFSVVLLAAIVASLGRFAWKWHRAALLGISYAAYVLAPAQLLGVAFVYHRFAPFIVPGLILSAGAGAPWLARGPRRVLAVVLCSVWLLVLFTRTQAFAEESADFDRAVDSLVCPKLRPLIIDPRSEVFPELAAYLHFPAYFQARHGGYYGFSFARYNSVLMRYRPGIDPGMADGEEWVLKPFDAGAELPKYDCVIARDGRTRPPPALRAAEQQGLLKLHKHAGRFWVYTSQH